MVQLTSLCSGMSVKQFPGVQVWWLALVWQPYSRRWTTRWCKNILRGRCLYLYWFEKMECSLQTNILRHLYKFPRTWWSPSMALSSGSTLTSRMWCSRESLRWWESTSSLTCSYQRFCLLFSQYAFNVSLVQGRLWPRCSPCCGGSEGKRRVTAPSQLFFA